MRIINSKNILILISSLIFMSCNDSITGNRSGTGSTNNTDSGPNTNTTNDRDYDFRDIHDFTPVMQADGIEMLPDGLVYDATGYSLHSAIALEPNLILPGELVKISLTTNFNRSDDIVGSPRLYVYLGNFVDDINSRGSSHTSYLSSGLSDKTDIKYIIKTFQIKRIKSRYWHH